MHKYILRFFKSMKYMCAHTYYFSKVGPSNPKLLNYKTNNYTVPATWAFFNL